MTDRQPILCPKHSVPVDEYGCGACEIEANERRELCRLAELALLAFMTMVAADMARIDPSCEWDAQAKMAFDAARAFRAERDKQYRG